MSVTLKRIELLCPLADKPYWVAWLLTHYQGTFDAMTIERYGVDESCLSRQESVLGYAKWVMFVLISDKVNAETLLTQIQPFICDRLNLTVVNLDRGGAS